MAGSVQVMGVPNERHLRAPRFRDVEAFATTNILVRLIKACKGEILRITIIPGLSSSKACQGILFCVNTRAPRGCPLEVLKDVRNGQGKLDGVIPYLI